MELFRTRNTATNIVFPLINATNTSAYYTSAVAWTSLGNATKTIYTWADTVTVPASATIAGNPTQLASTGEWYMTISASEISAASTSLQYMMIKLKADQILEQTILIHVTDYNISQLASTTNQVTVGTNNDKTNYTVSAQTNHPAYPAMSVSGTTVPLSADVRQWIGTAPNALQTGRVDSYVGVNNDKTGYSVTAQTNHPTVAVSAYTNFPQVYVSAGQVTNVTGNVSGSVNSVATSVTAVSVTNPVTVGTNNDKTNYTVSSGTITTVTGNVNGNVGGSVASVTNPVTVGTNNDKTNYTVSSGTITTVTNPVTINGSVVVSAYTNFPSVNVSSVESNAMTSADFAADYWNKVDSLTDPNAGAVRVSAIDSGLYVGTSAYTNFPQVYVSAGQVTNVTGNVSGSVNSVVGSVASVTNPVTVGTNNDKTNYTVSGYTNFPQVTVSANLDKTDYSISGTKKLLDNLNDINGTAVTATSIPAVTVGQVTVSAYNNFPQVYVSAGQVTNVTGNVSGSVNNVVVPQSVAIGEVTVSAYNNFPNVTVATNLDKTNYSISGTKKLLDNLNDINGSSVTATSIPAVTVGQVTVSAYNNFPQVYVSAGQVSNVTGNVSGSVNNVIGNVGGNVVGSVASVTGNVGGSVGSVVGQVSVSAQTNHPTVTVSAYTNFPQVTVSANLDKTNYTVSSGSITTVTGNVNGNVGGSVASVTNPVTVGTNNDKTNYTVSGYTNFPQVTVSANLDKTNYTVSSGTITTVTNSVSVSANSDKTGYALSTAEEDQIVDKVWDEMNAGHVISGSTGYNVSLLPEINDNVGTAIAGVPTNYLATSGVVTNGTVVAGTYSATWYDDGTYWQVETVGGIGVDVYLTFNLGSTRVSQITINGRFTAGVGRFANVFAYNYTTSAYNQISDSVTRMNNTGTDANYTYNLVPANRSSTGDVQIRFYSPSTTNGDDLYLDQVLVKGVEAGATPEDIANAVYDKMSYTVYDGKVWIDTVNGFSGTDVGIYGTPTTPVNNLEDAVTIATALGDIKNFYIYPNSSIVLSQDFDGWIFDGAGYFLSGNSYNVSRTIIRKAKIYNTFLTNGLSFRMEDCDIMSCSLGNCRMYACGLANNFTMLSAGDYYLDQCYSLIAGNNTPSATFNTGANASFRHYSGGIHVSNYTSANNMSMEGFGQIKLDANCTGGSIAIRGTIKLGQSNSAVTLVDSSRYENTQVVGGVTNSVSVSAQTNHPLVGVSAIDGGIYVGTSAYTNFPEVTVSANLDKTNYTVSSGTITTVTGNIGGNVSGSVNNVVVPQSITVGEVTVSAYNNFPQVTVSANLDKTNYTISGQTNHPAYPSMVVSAYTNFPQVTVSANLDKTNYTVSSGTITTITNPVTINGSVNVSSVDSNAMTSGDFGIDYWNKIDSLTDTNATAVRVSAIDGGLYVGTSAYTNFPQVTVGTNLDKTNYTVSSGTINTVSNPVTVSGSIVVSAYQNFPQVQVSGINTNVYGSVSAYQNFPEVRVSAVNNDVQVSATVTVDYTQIKNANLSAIDERFTFDGSAVNAFSVNELVVGSVTVSAYENFPQVTVSANLDKNNYTVSSGIINTVTNAVSVSAYQNFPEVKVSAINNGVITSSSFTGNVNAIVVDKGVLNDITVADILSGTVDTRTVEQILEYMLAYVQGRITVSGTNFTYYKQNNSTSAFGLSGTNTERTRF